LEECSDSLGAGCRGGGVDGEGGGWGLGGGGGGGGVGGFFGRWVLGQVGLVVGGFVGIFLIIVWWWGL